MKSTACEDRCLRGRPCAYPAGDQSWSAKLPWVGGSWARLRILSSPLASPPQVSSPSPCFHIHGPVGVGKVWGGKKLSNCQPSGGYKQSTGFPVYPWLGKPSEDWAFTAASLDRLA